MARRSVKVTYAHKRGRAKATAKLVSSPLQVLPPDHNDITRSEMSRRMLKRSRQVSRQGDDDQDQARLKNRVIKRARQNVQVTQPVPDTNAFQTPFSSAEYVHPSQVTCPLVPEDLSPVPIAKRILSRTSSRNLKENNTSLPLASPFHSRPSSPHPHPKSNQKARSSRIPLHLKPRTLSGALRKNDNAYARHRLLHKDSTASLNDRKLSRKDSTISLNDSKLSRKDSTYSLNELARNSPSKHQRFPSDSNPSYMLSHIAQNDWISPPKALTIHAGDCDPDTEFIIPSNSTQSSSASHFLVDRPQFFSTPPHSRTGSTTGLQAPNAPSYLAFFANSPHHARGEDFEMTDLAEHRKIHIQGNSIMSSSGSFTLRALQIPGAPDVPDAPDDHNGSAGSAPMSISDNVLAPKTSIGEYYVPLMSSPLALGMANSGPRSKISLGQDALPLPGTDPLVPPSPKVVAATRKQGFAFASGTSSPPDSPGSTARNAEECSANMHPPMTRCDDFSGATDLAQDMLSLDLGDRTNDPVQLPIRTRSLDSPAGITSKKTSTTKSKRNRAGTIRASDFARPATSNANGPTLTSLASTVAGPAGSLPGRTRSGTVVGPNSKLAVRPHPKGALKRLPAVQITQRDAEGVSRCEIDMLSVHEGPRLRNDEDFDFVDLGKTGKGRRVKKKIVHDDIMSDDPLLMVGPWRDEDWA